MSYIGQRPVVGRYIKLDQISSGFNGSNTSFSMAAGSQAVSPGTARNMLVSLGGVIQEPDTNFTVSGSTLTFTTAPVANTTFFAVIFGDMQSTGTPSDGTVLPASIASSGNFSFPQLTVTGTSSLGDDVTFTGANYNVVWNKSDDELEFVDNAKASFGTGADLLIYHDGNNSVLDNNTGNLYIQSAGSLLIQGTNNERAISYITNGAIELFYDNSKKFETTSQGVKVAGAIRVGNGVDMRIHKDDGSETLANFIVDGAVELYYDNSKKFETTAYGAALYDNDASAELRFTTTSGQVGSLWGNSNTTFGLLDGQGHFSVICTKDGSVDLYHDNSKKFETTTNGVEVTGDLRFDASVSGGTIRLGDDQKLFIGGGNDLQIYHNGSNSIIDSNTGNLEITSDSFFVNNSANNEVQIKAVANGAVELYHDNVARLGTTGSGVEVTGHLVADLLKVGDNENIYLGANNDFQLFHDPSVGNIIQSAFTNLVIKDTAGQTGAIFRNSGAVELNHNGTKKFETRSAGVAGFGDIICDSDSAKFKAGLSGDMTMYHNGTHSYLQNNTGNLYIINQGGISFFTNTNEDACQMFANGAVELYYDNVLKLETIADGARATGIMKVRSADLNVQQNTEPKYLVIATSSTVTITLTSLNGTGVFRAGGYANAGQGALGLHILFGGAMFATQHYNVNVLMNSAMQNTSISLTKNGTNYQIAITNSSSSSTLNLMIYLESTGAKMGYATA